MKQDERRYWLDDRRNVDKVYYGLLVLCAATAVAEWFFHKKVHFPWEGWFGFHGGFGFVGCVFLVLAAKQMRRILMRDEDYYD